MSIIAVTVVMFTAGCGDTSEQGATPEPKTVVVTTERTVEAASTVERTVEATAQPSVDSESSTQITSEITREIGQECDLGESSVTVTSAEQAQGVNAMGETLEGNFMIVEYDYTYGGSTSTDLDEPPFELLDGEGNTYSLDFDATSSYEIENDRNLIYETVQPGVSAEGAAIFEVAPDATNFTLLVADLVAPQANSTAEIPLPESTVSSPEGDGSEAEAEEAAGDYYRAAGLEDWAYTYDHLDSQTQNMFTEEEWFQKNQYYWDLNPTVYDILSVELLSDSDEDITEVTVRVTGEDGTSFTRTTYW
ncbi:MAG: DUF4352 domain-containing protein, partial [Rubrobacteraceae bacterium]